MSRPARMARRVKSSSVSALLSRIGVVVVEEEEEEDDDGTSCAEVEPDGTEDVC